MGSQCRYFHLYIRRKVEEDTNRNYWLTVEEAQQYSIVNKIISNRDEIK
ncbi:ATP-dependent Clp protease proteolytic subunit [Staphylococcus durrellii]